MWHFISLMKLQSTWDRWIWRYVCSLYALLKYLFKFLIFLYKYETLQSERKVSLQKYKENIITENEDTL